jgi:zinc/manganese transport system permease protein
MIELLAAPLAACLVLAAILGYFGVHILEREVIFVDLALGQIAALGGLLALLTGYEAHGQATYVFSIGSVFVGAALFSLARFRDNRVPQEAIIGIVYAVSAACAVLVLDRAPGGDEEMKAMLVGSILFVTWGAVAKSAAVFAVIGVIHFVLRKRFFQISADPEAARAAGVNVKLWDFLFYGTLGVVVALAVQTAGVLLVFSYLIVPAVCAKLFATALRVRLFAGWLVGLAASLGGLWASAKFDLPTGAAIVAAFGVALLVSFVALIPRRMRG